MNHKEHYRVNTFAVVPMKITDKYFSMNGKKQPHEIRASVTLDCKHKWRTQVKGVKKVSELKHELSLPQKKSRKK